MKRPSLVIAAVGALLVGGSLATAGAAAAAGNTLTVGNPSTCPTAEYGTIQAAVDAASTGDTILVCPGIFAGGADIATPGLTIEGAQHGVDARGRTTGGRTIATAAGKSVFTLESTADDTTIDGFTIQGTSGNNDGVADFLGASGLTLVNNLVQLNGNGVNMQNPDASSPAVIERDVFTNNNAGGDPGNNGNTGTGVFVSNGPANSTTIADDTFSKDSQTAINTAGDSSSPSTDLLITDNTSTNDATFVVATNSTGAIISDNKITVTTTKVPGGSGTGILDFGANTGLKITNNIMSLTGPSSSSGIAVSFYAGPSAYTSVEGNTVNGWYNGVKVAGGNTTANVYGNKLYKAQNDGIILTDGGSGASPSGVTVSHNVIGSAATYSCQDVTTGSGTAGTANTWLKNKATGAPSSPAAICPLPSTNS